MRAAQSKLQRLLVFMGCAVLFLCSCQTPQSEVADPGETAVAPELGVEPNQMKTVEPVSEPGPIVPLEKSKKPTPKAAGIFKQADQRGARVTEKGDGVWLIEKGERRFELREQSRQAILNGTVVYLNEVFAEKEGNFALSDSDFEYTLRPALDPPEIVLRSRTVVLDPGHGGAEPGSVNRSLSILEKDLNLDVSLRLQKMMEENGFKVVLTRYNDRLVPLEDRSQIANRSNAGVFVSIHFNAALNKEASGVETYLLTPKNSASSNDDAIGSSEPSYRGNQTDLLNFELGYRVQSRLIADLQRVDRGIKKARFKVLKDLECPGLLIECGFLSHGKEAPLINTPLYRQKLAESLSHSLTSILMTGRIVSSDQ